MLNFAFYIGSTRTFYSLIYKNLVTMRTLLDMKYKFSREFPPSSLGLNIPQNHILNDRHFLFQDNNIGQYSTTPECPPKRYPSLFFFCFFSLLFLFLFLTLLSVLMCVIFFSFDDLEIAEELKQRIWKNGMGKR